MPIQCNNDVLVVTGLENLKAVIRWLMPTSMANDSILPQEHIVEGSCVDRFTKVMSLLLLPTKFAPVGSFSTTLYALPPFSTCSIYVEDEVPGREITLYCDFQFPLIGMIIAFIACSLN